MTAVQPDPSHVEELVARARQHALGDLLRRTALRLPDKTGLVDGDVRLTYGYKVPKQVSIAEALPKNPSGKILKRQLRDEHAHLTSGA